MLRVRPGRWPQDLNLLGALDTSFTTDRIYRVIRDESSFALVEEKIDPPLRKEYGPLTAGDGDLPSMDHLVVAEYEGELAGIAAAKYETWNRRLVIGHLYAAARYRGRGIGRALVDELSGFARTAGARCLWLETQNVNYPAIQFYRRVGFRLCGLDESLYDPEGQGHDEVALFFVRELE
jgi:ribosomal protein S18 acetylase RimI-like enzyme